MLSFLFSYNQLPFLTPLPGPIPNTHACTCFPTPTAQCPIHTMGKKEFPEEPNGEADPTQTWVFLMTEGNVVHYKSMFVQDEETEEWKEEEDAMGDLVIQWWAWMLSKKFNVFTHLGRAEGTSNKDGATHRKLVSQANFIGR